MAGLLAAFLFFLGPWVVMGGALTLDRRTGRGLGMGLLSLALGAGLVAFALTGVVHIAFTSGLIGGTIAAVAEPTTVAAVYFLWAYPEVAVLVGGMAEASWSRHERWGMAIVISALVALVAVFFVPPVFHFVEQDGARGVDVTFPGLAVFALPLLVILVFSVWRTLRPALAGKAPQAIAAR